MTPEDAAREQGARKPERWQQIEQLFHAALEQQPGGRATFLAEACAGDQALRREVESLLAYKSHDGGFMETPVLEAAPRLLAEGQAESLVGRQVGLHKILSRLGAGGMGEVYRARDMKLGRDVALKVLPAAFARDPERVGRFRREAHMLAQLNHPNIAAIYAVDETDGVLFLALELVPGETLAERLTSSPLDVREALRICVQIAEALEAAHQKGVIHRDIKPANVKVTPEGKVKVLDFGLAKAFAGEGSGPDLSALPTAAGGGTRTGVIPGTPAYMSPEQARGKQLDKRTDIWSFGCVLYELLARRRAFPGETIPDTIAALLGREPDWGALPEGTPAGIHRLLRRCLEKDPNRRLRDVGDGRIEIEDALTGAPASPAPAPGVSQSKGRGRLAWAVAAVLALLFAAATVFVWQTKVVWENPLENAQFTPFTDFEGAEHDAAISPDGKFVAFRADRDGPFDVWLSQVGTGQFQNLTKGQDDELRTPTRSLGFSADGSEIWLAGAKDVRRLRRMPLMGGTPRVFLREGAVNVAWSPDGTRLVYHTGHTGDPMFVADHTGANATQIFVNRSPGGHSHYPTWSQDGRWIYFVSGIGDTNEMDLWRIAPSGGEPERLTHHSNDVRHPTPIDRRTVLYVSPAEDGSGPWLWALDVERKATRRVSFGLEKYTSAAASADGRRLVATVENPSAGLWSVPILDRVAEERDVKPFQLPTVRALTPRFGGASLFYLSSSGAGGGLWRYQDGRASEIWKGADGPLLDPPGVSPDGHRAAMVLRRQGKLRLHVISADGAELQPLAETIDARGTACWSRDGKWLLTGGNDAKGAGLFKIPIDGGAPVRLVDGKALNPVWSPDGSLIVYANPTVALYAPLLAVRPDGTKAELPAIQVRGGKGGGERYRFLPDGKGLVYMQGQLASQDFWLLDLVTMQARPLTHLKGGAAMRTFDITPDGKQIVFDRLRENSNIVLIDLPK